MKDRRRHRRVRKRLRVLYGERELTRTGFTYDLSEGGMFVMCDGRLPLGRRLHLQVFLDGENWLYFEGVPVREKQVPIELRSVVKGGFGVRFLPAREVLAGLFVRPESAPRVSRADVVVEYADVEALRKAHDAELRHGGVFVQLAKAPARDAVLSVELRLSFADASIEAGARVVHLVPGADGKTGVALVFVEPASVAAALGPHLPASP